MQVQQSSLETIPCAFCQSTEWVPLFQKKDKFDIEPTAFQVVECLQCHLIFVNPRPPLEGIGKFYPEYYQWREEEGPGSWVNKLEKAYRYHQLQSEIDRLRRNLSPFPQKVLDIGCGTGDRLYLLRQIGCEVKGVETSDQAQYARKHFNLDVFQGTLSQAKYPDNFFDMVTLYNVLEHVHQPKDVLEEIRRILKPNGVLIVEVPNSDCFQFKFFNAQWAAVDIPRDLFYYNFKTLSQFLKETGFSVQKVDYMTDFFHPPTCVISLFPMLDPQLIWSQDAKKRQGGILKRMFWAGLTLTVAPFVYFENLLKRGALMTVIARKAS